MKRVAATALLAMGLLHLVPAVSQADSSAAAQAAAEQARAEAARQLQAAASEFTVVTLEPTQWTDSSLGCRKPNAMYTDVMTAGYTVVLERQGQRHQVNVAGSRAVMCEPSMRISGTVRQPLPPRGLDRMTTLARQDLANRLVVWLGSKSFAAVRDKPLNLKHFQSPLRPRLLARSCRLSLDVSNAFIVR